MNAIMNEEEYAYRIHSFNNPDCDSDSNDDKSDFDEYYYENKPPPFCIDDGYEIVKIVAFSNTLSKSKISKSLYSRKENVENGNNVKFFKSNSKKPRNRRLRKSKNKSTGKTQAPSADVDKQTQIVKFLKDIENNRWFMNNEKKLTEPGPAETSHVETPKKKTRQHRTTKSKPIKEFALSSIEWPALAKAHISKNVPRTEKRQNTGSSIGSKISVFNHNNNISSKTDFSDEMKNIELQLNSTYEPLSFSKVLQISKPKPKPSKESVKVNNTTKTTLLPKAKRHRCSRRKSKRQASIPQVMKNSPEKHSTILQPKTEKTNEVKFMCRTNKSFSKHKSKADNKQPGNLDPKMNRIQQNKVNLNSTTTKSWAKDLLNKQKEQNLQKMELQLGVQGLQKQSKLRRSRNKAAKSNIPSSMNRQSNDLCGNMQNAKSTLNANNTQTYTSSTKEKNVMANIHFSPFPKDKTAPPAFQQSKSNIKIKKNPITPGKTEAIGNHKTSLFTTSHIEGKGNVAIQHDKSKKQNKKQKQVSCCSSSLDIYSNQASRPLSNNVEQHSILINKQKLKNNSVSISLPTIPSLLANEEVNLKARKNKNKNGIKNRVELTSDNFPFLNSHQMVKLEASPSVLNSTNNYPHISTQKNLITEKQLENICDGISSLVLDHDNTTEKTVSKKSKKRTRKKKTKSCTSLDLELNSIGTIEIQHEKVNQYNCLEHELFSDDRNFRNSELMLNSLSMFQINNILFRDSFPIFSKMHFPPDVFLPFYTGRNKFK